MKNNKKLNGINFRFNSKYMCLIFFIVGSALIAISCVNYEKPFSWWESWGKSSFNNAGTTLLVAGIISFFIEISTLRSFFQDSMKNILNDDFPLDAYSEENLEHFKYMISAHLVNKGTEELLKDTIYSYEKNLLEMATERYYEYHKLKSVIKPDRQNDEFLEECIVDYKIVNLCQKENKIQLLYRIYASSESDARRRYKIIKLSINGKPQKIDDIVQYEKITTLDESNFYDYKIKLTLNLGSEKSVIVHMEYEQVEQLYDRFHSYKITLPCKKLQHEIRINGGWELTGTAFTAFYFSQKNPDAVFSVHKIARDSIRVDFNDWVLPGGGYALYYDMGTKLKTDAL